MTCHEFDAALLSGGALSEEARLHLAQCPDCRRLAAAMAEGAPEKVASEALDRVRGEILGTLAPVRPMAPAGVFACLFLLSATVTAAIAAGLTGIKGLPRLTPEQAAGVFGALLGLLLLSAFALARAMRPGARTVRGVVVLGIALAATEAVFLTLFHDYTMGRFLHSGAACLSLGLACSVATALLLWFPLRRGYVVARASTGATIGALSGLAGLAALELHCPFLNVPHLAIWHAGVVVVSAGVGWAVGRISYER